MISETVVVRHHAHVDACHDGQPRSFFFSRNDAPCRHEFLDVFPVRDDETFEAELVSQNYGQNAMVDVSGDTIDLAGVDHDRLRAGFDCRVKRWQKIFAQVILGDPRGRAISSGQRKAVTHVVLQARRNLALRRHVSAFEATHKSHAHHFREIRILAKRLPETRPQWIATEIENWRKTPGHGRRREFQLP